MLTKNFYPKNPSGKYAATAKKELERLQFVNAINSRNEKELESLLKNVKYPMNNYVREAKDLLANLKAQRLISDESSDNLDDYIEYITHFPNGNAINEVRKRGEIVWWSKRENNAGVKEYQEYLNLFPNGVHRRYIKEKLDETMWLNAENTLTDPELYLKYLESFPQGSHNFQARDCVDWSVAEKRGPVGIRLYLENHPQGRFALRGKQILQSVGRVDDELEADLWEDTWSIVKSSVGNLPISSKKKVWNIWGKIIQGKSYISYKGVTMENGKAIVRLNNNSKLEFSGIVYRYYDGNWFPDYDLVFKENKD